METLSDIEKDIRARIKVHYCQGLEYKSLKMEFSTKFPDSYKNRSTEYHNNLILNTDRLYSDYDSNRETIIVYLPVIENDEYFPFSRELLIKLLLLYNAGYWLCQTITFPQISDDISKIGSYNTCGCIYQSICATVLSNELVKDSLLRIPFDIFLWKISSEYQFLKLFLTCTGTDNPFPGLTKTQIFGLIQKARSENQYITRDFIMDYFNGYIMDILDDSPHLFHLFKDSLSFVKAAQSDPPWPVIFDHPSADLN